MLSGHGDTESVAAMSNGRTSASLSRALPVCAARTRSGRARRGAGERVRRWPPVRRAHRPVRAEPQRRLARLAVGPLHGLGLGIGSCELSDADAHDVRELCGGAARLRGCFRAGRLRPSIVAANVVLLLGPPLLSQDVFGYLAFARLGVLHGLDPYTHVAAEAPTDAVFPFIGWPFQNSPYGPLFTLGTYPLAPLGLAGGLWALKAVAVACELGAVALTARAATRWGARRSRRRCLWA